MKIIFTPLLAGKPWNGRTLTTEPLGGSESAVGFLARALALRGHQVIVYTHHNEQGVFDGVEYRNAYWLRDLHRDVCDVHISSRWPDMLSTMPPDRVGQRILWVHDLGNQVLQGDKIVFLSQYHISQYPIDGEAAKKCFVVGNGVNLGDFLGYKPLEERDGNVMLWTSNPDRGLHVAGRILQELRQRWPELTLHLFGRAAVYGWGQEAELPYYPRDEDRDGIVLHEPVSKAALAQVLKTAWCLFYPTTWPETYCIATLEAQAAGTPVIAAPYGALTETVKGGILTYDFEQAIEQLQNPDVWNQLSNEGRKYAAGCDWLTRAQQWEELFNA